MLRVGVVGCGSIAGTHAWALNQMENVTVAGFADIDIERAKRFSNDYTEGKAAVYSDLSQMLQDAKLDVLHICTPHYLHVPMAIEALRANVSVFSEKPPAISMEQFNELEKVVNESSAKLGFCFQNRYNKTIEKTDEILASGKLGKVIGSRAFVTWRRDEDYYATDWKGILKTEGGGALINQSIHTLDLMLKYLGKPQTVKANLSNHHLEGKIEVEDTVDAWLSFEDGKRGCFYASTAYAVDAPVILELQCESGSISIIDNCVTVRAAGCEAETMIVHEDKVKGKSYWGNGHLKCMLDFYSKIKSGETFKNDISGVRNTMETMMKIYDFR